MTEPLADLLENALQPRLALLDAAHEEALRLFNGFTEGCPGLALDLYARTLVIHDHGAPGGEGLAQEAAGFLRERLPWLQTGLLKRRSGSLEEKRGKLLFGTAPDRKVREHGTWYALDLSLHQDASLYLDTRQLRLWARQTLAGRSVLNTFAYTGSLGAAALAGGASRVVQTDLDRDFLNLAKATCTLNGFPIDKNDFIAGDFFPVVSGLKRTGAQFDCVFIDPPFFSSTKKGRLDLNRDSARLINKVRPLIADGGWLVAVNNALYVSGGEYMAVLEDLCADGYLEVERLVPAPQDFTGFAGTRRGQPPADPAPFNHSTKMAVLRVRRKA